MTRTLHRLKNGVIYRPRFFLTFLVAAILFIALNFTSPWAWSTNLLLGWNVAVYCYLFMTMKALWNSDSHHILKRAQQQDPSKWIILFLVILTLVMCFIAIIVELTHLPKVHSIKIGHIVLSITTIISAWFFMHTVFAIHYAHDFYLSLKANEEGGLDFPKTAQPTYPDFLYFSYVIGTSAQTADVSITTKSMRILNILHILLAYCFNTTILAICINVAASLITPS